MSDDPERDSTHTTDEPTDQAAPAGSNDSTENTESAGSNDPTESTESTGSNDPTESTESTGSNDLAADADSEPIETTDHDADRRAIELADLTKEYEGGGGTVTALESVNVSVDRGEFVAVMGPSGSGKSTMLNMVGLLDEPTAGTIELAGEDVTGLSTEELTDRRRESIGFVFQNYYLLPTLTAVENVELPTTFSGSVPRGRAEWLLNQVDLGDRLQHRPTELSGGQKQRVAIARALVNEPEIVLADEPTGNLDTDTGDQILSLFRRIVEQQNVALVAVTHDPNVASRADRRIDLLDGRIQS